MQSLTTCIFHDFRASQHHIAIVIGVSRDKGQFFPSKIVQRKVGQRIQNSLEIQNSLIIN